MSILDKAKEIVHNDRQKEYGPPIEGFTITAKIWSAMLGIPISAEQVALLFAVNKISRQLQSHKEDNLIDMAGYAEVAHMIRKESERRVELLINLRKMSNKDLCSAPSPSDKFEANAMMQEIARRIKEFENGAQ